MSRVPKFRAWYGIEMYDEPVICNGEFYLDWRDFEDGKTYDGAVLMQSTGLKDKNGVELFEGDIVTGLDYDLDPLKGKIIFKYGCFLIESEEGNYIISNDAETEVIGNIYENKELLE